VRLRVSGKASRTCAQKASSRSPADGGRGAARLWRLSAMECSANKAARLWPVRLKKSLRSIYIGLPYVFAASISRRSR
jgi:hypothetical protein